MHISPYHWWTRDTALHTFIYAQFLLSLPFAVFGTYVQYQLQIAGFVIGTDGQGGPCTTFCIVDWAGSKLDLNSVLLYMTACGYGLGGLITLILSAYSDYWSRKHLLITCLFVLYGVISIPVYWLQGYSNYDFQVLSALSIIFTIATNILVAVLSIYIPYCMRSATAIFTKPTQHYQQTSDSTATSRRTYGFKMVIKGTLGSNAGALLMYIIVISISQTAVDATAPGLIVTTAVGFVTIAASVVVYLGLPKIPAKESLKLKQGWLAPMSEFLAPLRDLTKRKSMAVLLITFTIFNDTWFAIASVQSQLFILELKPDSLEISLYALSSCILGVICSIGFMIARPRIPIRLETWVLMGYGVLLLCPLWGYHRSRWEFYVQQFLLSFSGIVVTTAFRVMFSEMMPPRNEVRWFSLQYVLSCATVWVNYVASAPLQNATHQLRFPLVISLIFMLVAFALEVSRTTLSYFKQDRERRLASGKAAVDEVTEFHNVTKV